MVKRGILLAVVVLLITPVLCADSVSGQMSVSATVVGRARLAIESQPAAVDVTAEDIARGYVDVEAPIVHRGLPKGIDH